MRTLDCIPLMAVRNGDYAPRQAYTPYLLHFLVARCTCGWKVTKYMNPGYFLGEVAPPQATSPTAIHFSVAWSVVCLSSVTLVHPA